MDVLSMDKQLEKIKQQKDHFLEFMPIVLFEFVWGGVVFTSEKMVQFQLMT